MEPLFHIPIRRTRDGGETFYIEKYWCLPIGRHLRIHGGTFCLSDLKNIGINLSYKGEEIFWRWPWKSGELKWLSLCSEGYFGSLKEIDKFWDDYNEAMIRNRDNSCETYM